ncbi:MAG: hypothetical protein QW416_08030 [Candidatus Nitrosocaldaceae archaeon]
MYYCPICFREYKRVVDLRTHFRYIHAEYCNICRYTDYTDYKDVVNHYGQLVGHSTLVIYRCNHDLSYRLNGYTVNEILFAHAILFYLIATHRTIRRKIKMFDYLIPDAEIKIKEYLQNPKAYQHITLLFSR